MKTKLKALAATAALSLSFAIPASAQSTGLAECLSEPLVQFDGTIVDAAIATPALSTLVDAVVAAGLADALASAENITVYAPTNDAFAAIPGPILETIVGNTDILTAVLTYHVTPSLQDPRRFVTPVRRGTLQGQHVFYDRSMQMPMVNNAGVDCTGVRTTNGIVWIIDGVLLPTLK